MAWVRRRYGLPVVVYGWLIGAGGILLLLYNTQQSVFPVTSNNRWMFLLFLALHAVASFLHFQYARLNIVITFESSFTIATLLVFGPLPAVWIAVTGIFIGSIKRLVERRWILQRSIPLSYEIGIIVFNTGMVALMWLFAGWTYVTVFDGEIPLLQVSASNVLAIFSMFLAWSLVNHVCLLVSSYLQGIDPFPFFRKALIPALLTEMAIVPFGVVMALAFNRMGAIAFVFLAITLLLSNGILRRLSIIRYDLEEKIKQLTSLHTIGSKILSLRGEKAVVSFLYNETTTLLYNKQTFFAEADESGLHLLVSNLNDQSVLARLAEHSAKTMQPFLVRNSRKDAPVEFTQDLLNEEIRSCVIVPLRASGKIYGVFGAYSNEFGAFSPDDLTMLIMVADQAALALENSKLYSTLTDHVSELERLNKELRQLDRMKSDFLANISHELRTPLTAIKGYLEYIRKQKLGPLTPLQEDGIIVVQRNIVRLQRLINDLLDYTRLEFRKTRLAPGPCSFEQIWQETYEQHEEMISKKRIRLAIDISPRLPVLFVDSNKFFQAIDNLMSNAVKFTPDGGAISVKVQRKAGLGRYPNLDPYRDTCAVEALIPLEVLIQDNGIGIPAEAIPRIFDRFYQVDSSNTRKYGGTGLGLAIVKSVLDAHGSKIEVESEPGAGTTFRFLIPGIEAADIPAAVKPALDHASSKYLT